MRRRAGFSVVEALIATLLAGIALAGLATVAAVSSRALRQARDTTVAVTLAGETLETLRAGPRQNGADVVTDAAGTRFTRRWSARGGRGRPAALSSRVDWSGHAVDAATEVP